MPSAHPPNELNARKTAAFLPKIPSVDQLFLHPSFRKSRQHSSCVGPHSSCVGSHSSCVGSHSPCVGSHSLCVGSHSSCVGSHSSCVPPLLPRPRPRRRRNSLKINTRPRNTLCRSPASRGNPPFPGLLVGFLVFSAYGAGWVSLASVARETCTAPVPLLYRHSPLFPCTSRYQSLEPPSQLRPTLSSNASS